MKSRTKTHKNSNRNRGDKDRNRSDCDWGTTKADCGLADAAARGCRGTSLVGYPVDYI